MLVTPRGGQYMIYFAKFLLDRFPQVAKQHCVFEKSETFLPFGPLETTGCEATLRACSSVD